MNIRLILIALGLFSGVMFATNGALLLFRPDLFLRFLDWQNPGDYVGKTAKWRRDVYNNQWKFLGIIFLAFGVFTLGVFIRLLLNR